MDEEQKELAVPHDRNKAPAQMPGEAASPQTNHLSVAGLVCGIIGVFFSFVPIVNFFTASILGILAIVFGAISKKRDGTGTSGIVLGAVALGIILLYVIGFMMFFIFAMIEESATY